MLLLVIFVYLIWIEFMIMYSLNILLWFKVMLFGIDCLIKGLGWFLIV